MTSLLAPDIEMVDSVLPDQDELDGALRTAMLLGADVERHIPLRVMTESGELVQVSPDMAHMLVSLYREIARGRAVMIASTRDQEISTGVAAQLLQVSRPHVVTLIERGILQSRAMSDTPGTHRRLRMADVLAYRQRLHASAASMAALEAARDALDVDIDDLDIE